MGTFNRRPLHKGRMMKALTTLLLIGLVTMLLWSASVTGDQSTLKEVLGYDENYCRGKSDGIFCKTNEGWKRDRYNFGECCQEKCYGIGFGQDPACDQLREVREKDSDLYFCYGPVRPNTPCRFKNANNEYEDGQCCNSLCMPLEDYIPTQPGSSVGESFTANFAIFTNWAMIGGTIQLKENAAKTPNLIHASGNPTSVEINLLELYKPGEDKIFFSANKMLFDFVYIMSI